MSLRLAVYPNPHVDDSGADNFDEYWRVAAKITPTTTPLRSTSPPPSSTMSMHSRPPSVDPNSGGAPDRDGAYNVRSVPVRIYLPDGPILQDLCPPVLEDGTQGRSLRSLSEPCR